MNKKGMTLMEVLVSLVLISIVMIFIVNLLSDLKNEGILSNRRNEDSLTRASFINVNEADLINSDNYLVKFKKECNQSANATSKRCYQFYFKNNTVKTLYVTGSYIAYGTYNLSNNTHSMEKWDLNYGTYDTSRIVVRYVNNSNGYQTPSLLTIHIPVNGVDAAAKNKFDVEITALSTTGRFTCEGC